MFLDFDIDMATDLKVNQKGFLDFHVYEVDIKFGESQFLHENPWVAFFMHQIIYYAIIVLENSVYFVGKQIFTSTLGPAVDRYLNHYKLPVHLPSPFLGQDASAEFTFDYRQLSDPYIGEGLAEFYFSGEMLYEGKGCILEHDYMSFAESETFSQLVMTESAASCIMQNFFISPIGKLKLNEKKLNQLFERKDLKMDTTSISHLLPVFEERVGKNKQLKVDLSFSKSKVEFYVDNVDIVLKTNMHFSISEAKAKAPELIYDEIRVLLTLNLETSNDILFPYIEELKLDINQKYGQRSQPIRNDMKLSENEYKEFISTLGFTLNYVKKWLNDVHFRDGVKFPYGMNEFDSTVSFLPKQMHIMIEVEEQAEEFFEDEFLSHRR
uniref:Uncharacterized protein n=1 Tax=Strombidium rassoulzadegani TaxID=1082188 RepID=A0A7S3CRX8_9SPIT|mmetsp:Transcript_5617/g.9679  ORF Transcript_5617/g.9679 Transcript_5617/m.9679 type:complete len:381 (+) Transcript_5617:463-1605(+)